MRACALALLLAAPATTAAESETALARCAAGLARTLAVMEARPLMKEELATGLMWLRLDARRALDRGDAAACNEDLAAVEVMLGLAARPGE